MSEHANSVGAQAPADAAPGIPVRATSLGWLGNVRVHVGSEFTIPDEAALGLWMERLDGGPSRKQLNEQKRKSAEETDRVIAREATVAVAAAVKASRGNR